MYIRAGRPAFARPCVGIHKSTGEAEIKNGALSKSSVSPKPLKKMISIYFFQTDTDSFRLVMANLFFKKVCHMRRHVVSSGKLNN